jgi:hypothetical protein
MFPILPEAAGAARPEEGDEGRCREGSEADTHQRDGRPVEELPPRDADQFGVGRLPRLDLLDRLVDHRDRCAARADAFGLGVGAGADVAFGLCGDAFLAGAAVALHGLARQRARSSDIGAAGHGEERDGGEDDDRADRDGDDCCSAHRGISFQQITVRRTGRRPTAGRS